MLWNTEPDEQPVQIYNVDQEFVLQIDADSPENDRISICNLGWCLCFLGSVSHFSLVAAAVISSVTTLLLSSSLFLCIKHFSKKARAVTAEDGKMLCPHPPSVSLWTIPTYLHISVRVSHISMKDMFSILTIPYNNFAKHDLLYFNSMFCTWCSPRLHCIQFIAQWKSL